VAIGRLEIFGKVSVPMLWLNLCTQTNFSKGQLQRNEVTQQQFVPLFEGQRFREHLSRMCELVVTFRRDAYLHVRIKDALFQDVFGGHN
jgi:hypothetical protein